MSDVVRFEKQLEKARCKVERAREAHRAALETLINADSDHALACDRLYRAKERASSEAVTP